MARNMYTVHSVTRKMYKEHLLTCIFVVVKLMFLNGVRERLSVQGEQNGAQYGPLGNSRLKWNRF